MRTAKVTSSLHWKTSRRTSGGGDVRRRRRPRGRPTSAHASLARDSPANARRGASSAGSGPARSAAGRASAARALREPRARSAGEQPLAVPTPRRPGSDYRAIRAHAPKSTPFRAFGRPLPEPARGVVDSRPTSSTVERQWRWAARFSQQRHSLCSLASAAHAQQTAAIGFKSVGRGAPLVSAIPREYPVTDLARLEMYPDNDLVVGPWRPQRPGANGAARAAQRRLRVERREPRRRRAAARRSVHDEGFLQGQSALERPALLPLQQPVGRRSAARRLRARRVDRRRSAAHGGVGLLRPRLSARGDREPVRLRDGASSTTKRCSRRRAAAAARRSTRTRPCPASSTAATSGRARRTGTRSCSSIRRRRSCRC